MISTLNWLCYSKINLISTAVSRLMRPSANVLLYNNSLINIYAGDIYSLIAHSLLIAANSSRINNSKKTMYAGDIAICHEWNKFNAFNKKS